MIVLMFFFFKQKTAYEMRISYWSSDVCSSDLHFTQISPVDKPGFADGCGVDEEIRTHAMLGQHRQRDPMIAQVAVIKGDDRTNALGRAEPVTRTGAATVMDENLREMLAKCCFAEGVMRSEERVEGKECVRRCRSR